MCLAETSSHGTESEMDHRCHPGEEKDRIIYLSPILDMFNGEVVSYVISDSPGLKMVMTTLDNAFKKGIYKACGGRMRKYLIMNNLYISIPQTPSFSFGSAD